MSDTTPTTAAPTPPSADAAPPDRRVARALASIGLAVCVGAAWYLGRPIDDRTAATVPQAPPDGIRLVEVAADVGITHRHTSARLDPKLANIEPILAGIGAAVSVTDFDGDGRPDLYATSGRFGTRNSLYRNRGDGGFDEVAGEVGLAELSREGEGACTGSTWADFDADGDTDVLVYRWGYPALFAQGPDGRFEEVTEQAGLRHWINSNGAVWFDYDGDGDLDLYVTAYLRSDVDLWNLASTKIMQSSFEFADNGGRNRMFRNRGDGTFEDVTDATGLGSTRWTLAAAAADFDGDGRPDLYLANDYGSEELFLNREGRRFELAESVGLADDSKSGMCVAVGDVQNRGRLDVFVTNISEMGYLLQGNNLRLNHLADLERFLQTAQGPVADCGWAWGAQFGDLDRDGWTDLFVANGYISASRDHDYWYGMSKVASGTGGIFEDAANWPEIGDASLSGYQRSRVLRNVEGRSFQDVAESAGVLDRFDGRAVALVDLWDRGVLDVVVANQDGPLLVYRNEGGEGHHALRLRLTGTRSNREAIGAEVVVEAGGRVNRQVVTTSAGFSSQNDLRLLFGLGEETTADRVTITWPSGTVQTLEGLAAGVLHELEEPAE